MGQDTTAYIVINDKRHIEYLRSGEFIIKSKLDWVSDCEYNATMTEITLPNFPFKPGDIMNVKVDKIEGTVIYCTMTVQGRSFRGEYKLIE